jgi:hypothetical protein
MKLDIIYYQNRYHIFDNSALIYYTDEEDFNNGLEKLKKLDTDCHIIKKREPYTEFHNTIFSCYVHFKKAITKIMFECNDTLSFSKVVIGPKAFREFRKRAMEAILITEDSIPVICIKPE